MDGLVKGRIFNYVNGQRAKDSGYFPEGGLISYDEFLEYWKGIVDVIAE